MLTMETENIDGKKKQPIEMKYRVMESMAETKKRGMIWRGNQ